VDFRFEVEVTGVGIAADVIPRLFQSFSQSDSSVTRRYGGTGLGLAIVRRLCEQMGGECGVSSQSGAGSCFWFTLPLQLAPAAAGQAGASAEPGTAEAPTHALRVLLVEDNLVNQEVAAGLLESLGCEATVAPNGQQALRLLLPAHEFDLVLMDCQMPVMDGYEATRRLRNDERQRGGHVPIIALTANAMVGDREQCLAAGMDDFLSKPFQLPELKRLLGRWGTRRQRPPGPIAGAVA
jgi:CheY-like chemotaxis protein